MQKMASIPSNEAFYIFSCSDKGDCVFCSDGVLYRDKGVEEAFEVKEGYRCDRCSNVYIEAYLFHKKRPWEKNFPRRYFAPLKNTKGRIDVF